MTYSQVSSAVSMTKQVRLYTTDLNKPPILFSRIRNFQLRLE
ncbi:hypothetical protein NARC_60062 [Candidatus Nitrosocosmicus arcticus]|uniref:Uncharacterized protein n=1 Tax=Candidatus Nitrosocosmicus arcticus TaxID=2035267 RepID=A0A557SVP8_9ARCH|nr:hypothetical protein NARC_60062 [Candidatus Nitrosocosmicus arcticus]